MSEHDLELRLLTVARALDAEAPALDVALLGTADRRRPRWMPAAIAVVAALACVTAASAAVSAIDDMFRVDSVPDLESVGVGAAPPFAGRRVQLGHAQQAVPFRLRSIPSLGQPDAAYVRDDVGGGMASLSYEGRLLLTQWSATEVSTRVAVVPSSGIAEDVSIGSVRALWIAGSARGTFTLVGADGTVHRELFDVDEGALLWQDEGIAFLLQGAGTKSAAAQLAVRVSP